MNLLPTKKKAIFWMIVAIGVVLCLAYLNSDTIYSSSLMSKANVHHDLKYWTRNNTVDTNFWPRPRGDKFLAFRSWGAGFNNERISLELAFSFALLFNRTLVLPPRYKHYNLKQFAYEDFFDIQDMKKIIPIVTFQEFQILTGVEDGYKNIEKRAHVLSWPDMPHSIGIFVFPEKPDQVKEPEKYLRMMTFAGKKRENIIRDIHSDPAIKDAEILFFPTKQLFCHFYAYIHCTDPALDRYMRKAVRNHIHLRNDIVDAASVVLNHLGNEFYTMHIRRGDFQYTNQRYLKGTDIYKNIENLVPEGATLYIATDEKKEEFDTMFGSVFKKRWKVKTYNDFAHLLEVPSNWIGIIEQIIAARGKAFIGTKMSTFSGYITRLRGYMSDIKNKEIYFTDTKYPHDYNNPKYFSNVWPTWNGHWLEAALWAREYKEAWEIES